jgi:hypothetical protein
MLVFLGIFLIHYATSLSKTMQILRLNLRLTAITLLQLDGQSVEILYKSESLLVGRARFERATIALKVRV